jgi:hypothetical protein
LHPRARETNGRRSAQRFILVKNGRIIQKDREKRRNARPSLWNEGKKRNHEV